MSTQAQKLDLIQWVASLDDPQLIQQLTLFKKKSQSTLPTPKRVFGSGKNVFLAVTDNFNDPIEAFKDYMP
ncbi:hypothetical protein HMF3257_30190 [Spirosoma telluris]|uniref:DUF2281 domain-containing protein n=2 Tax=Spirosoma telluris TaxID=2183553 RepID=A0A327NRU4_9BACT|nr:hypothetical protein HMF3257_30190 [Spirosoma telluris]